MKKRLKKWIAVGHRRAGHTMAEYALIAAIISIAGIILLTRIGQSTVNLLERTNTNMPQ